MQREKEKIRIIEKSKPVTAKEKEQSKEPKKEQKSDDSGYGKDVKGDSDILSSLQAEKNKQTNNNLLISLKIF